MVKILPQKSKNEYNEIFSEVVKSVIHDEKASAGKRKHLKILEESADYVYVYDNIDYNARCYTLKNPANIDKKYIKNLCCFTPTLQKLPYVPKENIIVEWLDKNLDKNMLMAVNGIVFMNEVADAEFIKNWANKHLHKEQMRYFKIENLPYGKTEGISWFRNGLVFVNCGSIMKNIAVDKDRFFFGEKDSDTFESDFKLALIHEIRHNAQDNLYLEEKHLQWINRDKEEDAEEYAKSFVYEHFAVLTKRNYKVKELENTMRTFLKKERLKDKKNNNIKKVISNDFSL